MTREYGQQDMWRESFKLEAERARELAEMLELRARDTEQSAARQAYLDLLDLKAGDAALEVGCGSGAVTRDLARRVGPAGRAVGLEPSAELLSIAAEIARSEGLDQIEWRQGGGESLPFGDAEFDVVLAVTTLAHMPNAEQCVPELVRVTRHGGRVGIFDLDGDGVVIAHPDRGLTRRIVMASSDSLICDGWLARRMPSLLAAAGLRVDGVRAFTPLERTPGGFYAGMAVRRAGIALQTGAITQEEHEHWLGQLRDLQATSGFLGGQTHLFIWGTRP